ncbi:MAG TPA: fasciclin domain-containing protein [Ilumatobacteraceae bacterium]|nr:fasciclin domain-containing protein [Ilumatobacteraceae bacterium]
MNRTPKFRLAAVAVTALTVLAACSDDSKDSSSPATEAPTTPAPEETMAPETTAAPDTTMEPGTIVDVAVAAGDFTTLVAAVQAAGLVDTLSGEGPFTVFAPTDEAFAAALESLGLTAEELLANKELLTAVLTYHVVPGKVLAADVVGLNGQEVATVNGASITVTVDGSSVMVNDANVVATDVMASNGVIHVIDKVLLPPQS